ncbi:hypothetical protein [Aquipuribacter nitratireducens]|uniref:Alpha/beta hydrolase family protein n=1 Tax=Aquipuribacter nitratireducens TaxID=650104 RepID=A0ABW0GNA4_9MICO
MSAPVWLSLAAHAVGGVDWQAALRRTGMPYRHPAAQPTRSAAAVGGALAGSLAASTCAAAALVAVAGVPAGALRHVLAAAAAGVAAPFPVLGVPVAAWAETACARRAGAAGTTPRPPALRAALATVAFGAVHAGIHQLVRGLLDAALPVPEPSRPVEPSTGLNVPGPDVEAGESADGFVVYLDGVGRCEARTTPVGRALAAAVSDRLPRWHVVLSVMPSDVTQEPAWRRPVTGPLWRRLHRSDGRWLVARGVWEAVVALDPRYRDRLAEAHTTAVVDHLVAAGYRRGGGTPVVLVGLSGGAQTALRSASEVARALGGAPVDVVTFGAFADGSADLHGVRRVHAVVSWGDPAELLPVLLFPSRWTALGVGAWHRAKREGRVVVRRHDFATHIGPRGYFSATATTPDGRTRLAQAADLVASAARELSRGSRSRVVR